MGKKQRSPHFKSLDDITADAEKLQASGYVRGGKWSLGQICEHLSIMMEYELKGFPMTMPRFIQKMVRWAFWKTIAERKSLSMSMPAPAMVTPSADVTDAAGVERLKKAVAAIKASQGPYHPSPVFGPLTRDEWNMVHLWHSEHHLAFLAPGVPGGAPKSDARSTTAAR